MVRIAGGELRGRALRYPPGRGVRPSMERTRLALFSMLGERLDGLVFADVFAGGGAVGIEALSRGARRVHFVENGGAALQALRANLEMTGIAAERWVVHARPVAAILAENPCPLGDAHIVFADPPYDLDPNSGLLDRLRIEDFSALRCLVIEHAARTVLAPHGGLIIDRERRFGDTMLTVLVPGDGSPSDGA